jgi:hypothetical protein
MGGAVGGGGGIPQMVPRPDWTIWWPREMVPRDKQSLGVPVGNGPVPHDSVPGGCGGGGGGVVSYGGVRCKNGYAVAST